MEPPPELEFDYSQPKSEPSLLPADSVSWRIFKNPISLFVGGVAAVILELAEPSVRSGVWSHSSFRKDAATRLRRTGAAAMMTVYGPRTAAEEMIRGVVRAHEKVKGTTFGGKPYHANDPRLLSWVQATASFGFIQAYHRFVVPLTFDEQSQAFREGSVPARLYGASESPKSVAEWERLYKKTRPSLEQSEVILEFLEVLRYASVMPWPLRSFQRLLIRAAVELVPLDLRNELGLQAMGLSRAQYKMVRFCGAAVDRFPLISAPPAQACVRMGLDPVTLYRRSGVVRDGNGSCG